MASVNSDHPALEAPHSEWVVQKFGGTSVGKFAVKILEQVVQFVHPRNSRFNFHTLIIVYRPSLTETRVAIVCSARSSSTKAEGTTNR